MTTHSPSPEEFPRPSTLAGQKLPPPQEEHNLLGEPWVNPGNVQHPPNRGEPLAIFPPPPEDLHLHRKYAPPNWLGTLATGVAK